MCSQFPKLTTYNVRCLRSDFFYQRKILNFAFPHIMKTLMTSGRKLLTLLLSLLLPCSPGKAASIFSPLVRNWSTADQGAGRQNWDIAQDKDGVMYFANNSGLLEFDGYTWNLIQMPAKANVRSLAISADGRIYVGSFRQFGYFSKLSDGSMQYHSISDNCPEKLLNDEIWSIIIFEDTVYFQSFSRIYVHTIGRDGPDAFEFIDTPPVNLFLVEGRFYTQIMDGNFCLMEKDGKQHGIWNWKDSRSFSTVSVLPYGDGRVLVATANSGLFIYDPVQDSYEKFDTQADKYLEGGDVNRGLMTVQGDYVFGSGSTGLLAIDAQGNLLWRINRNEDLQNETVLGLLCDHSGNVWVALDDGVSLILTQSAFSSYQSPGGMMGMVYDVMCDDDQMYIATNKGLYSIDYNFITPVDRVKGQTWFIKRFNDDVFVGNNIATYRLRQGRAIPEDLNSGSICIRSAYLEDNELHLLEGTYVGIRRYDKNPVTGRWQPVGLIPDTFLARNIETDANYHIWYEHNNRGIRRITLADNLLDVEEVKEFSELSIDPVGGRLTLFKINGRIAITDGDSFFTYDDIQDKIIPYPALNDVVGHVKGVHQATRGDGTSFWLAGNKEIVQIDCSGSKYKIIREIPLTTFGFVSEDRSSVVYDQKSGYTFLCLNNRIIRIDKPFPQEYRCDLSLLKVKYTNSRGYGKSVGMPRKVRTIRGCNNVSFTLRFPEYDNYGYLLQYRLLGLDDNWTIINSTRLEQNFERLKYKRYRYQARVINTAGEVVDEVDVPLKVCNYWYASTPMILLYLILLALVCVLLGRKSKQRHTEIITLKDKVDEARNEKEQIESQLKMKESELASMVVGGMATDARKWDIFKQNFDRLEEHFFSTLSERYPDLTSSDLKFCALLRLNMSTKEIADALNLSTRGVESARYRLRKKFKLNQGDSLTAFIHSIK